MNKLLICRMLGLISLLIGGSMGLSLPWASPLFGQSDQFEAASFLGLLGSMAVCGVVGGGLMYLGRKTAGQHLHRREAIAVVGLSWLLATVLGALPFWLSGTCRGLDADGQPELIYTMNGGSGRQLSAVMVYQAAGPDGSSGGNVIPGPIFGDGTLDLAKTDDGHVTLCAYDARAIDGQSRVFVLGSVCLTQRDGLAHLEVQVEPDLPQEIRERLGAP